MNAQNTIERYPSFTSFGWTWKDIGMLVVKDLVKPLVQEKEDQIKVLSDFGFKLDQLSLPITSRSPGSTVVANNVTFASIDAYMADLMCMVEREYLLRLEMVVVALLDG